MKLLHAYVENFGTLAQYELHASEGLNTLYQPNGWGKSTLAVFIKAMLYGLPATAKRSLDENERKKYTPWQGGTFGGSIEFESEKGRFRAERFFGAKESEDTFALYDLSTGLPSSAYSANLGEELFGIDADGFERSSYLSQRALFGKAENNSITAKLNNLLDDVDDIGSYDRAVAVLESQRKHYVLTGNRGLLAELERERLSVQAEIEKCMGIEKSAEELERQAQTLRLERKASEQKLAEKRAELKRAGLARERRAYVIQSKALQRELAEKRKERRSHEQFFAGAVPTAEELNTAKQTLLQIQQAQARLSAMELTVQDRAELNALKKKYPASLPNEEAVARLQQKEAELRRAETLCTASSRELEKERQLGKKGMPTSAELLSVQRVYHTAKEKEREVQRLCEQLDAGKGHKSALSIVPPILLTVGSVLSVVFFLMQNTLAAVLLLAVAVTGGVLQLVSVERHHQHKKKMDALKAERERLSQEAASMLQTALSDLRRYGMKDGESPEQVISTLSLYCAGEQERISRCKRIEGELAGQTAQLHSIQSELEAELRRYLPSFDRNRQDYAAAIAMLQRDALQLEQLFSVLQRKERSCEGEKEALSRLRAQMMPFLNRYDSTHTLSASACMDAVLHHYNEWLRLGRELAEQEKSLSAFLQSKQLTGDEVPEETADFEALSEEEKALQQEIEAQSRRVTELDGRLERLRMETDRLPELRERASALSERIASGKERLNTITTTMRLLEESKTALSTRYLAGMQESFDAFLGQLSEQEHLEAVVDASLDIRTRQSGKSRPSESLSRGWRDLVSFCLRLSLTEALYREGERPILLLDDPFVNFDDRRMEAAKQLLQKLSERYQIFYFVCHSERI